MADVSGYNCHPMYKRCSCNQGVTIGARISHMKRSAAAVGDNRMYGNNAPCECWSDVAVHPGTENLALLRVAAFNELNSYF